VPIILSTFLSALPINRSRYSKFLQVSLQARGAPLLIGTAGHPGAFYRGHHLSSSDTAAKMMACGTTG